MVNRIVRGIKRRLKKLYRKITGKPDKKKEKKDPFLGKPSELFGFSSSGSASVVYIGNGASGNTYQQLIDQNQLDGKAYSDMGGFYNECAVINVELAEDGSIDHRVISAFIHPDKNAVLAGFHLRKKKEKDWLWYLEDGTWQSGAPEVDRAMFAEGDPVPAAEKDEIPVYILTAEWVDSEGNSMNCGYRMFRNNMMAHALGGMDGQVYLNTLPAFENAIKNGYKYFETDFTLTSDKKLVLCHGWSEKDCLRFKIDYDPGFKEMTYDMARQLVIHGNKMMDTREFYEYIRELPDDYVFEIDYHNVKAVKARYITERFVNDFNDDENVFRRLLIQVYSPKMFSYVDEVHRFEVYQYCLAKNIEDLDYAIQNCLDLGICALAIRAGEATDENIRKLKTAGMFILGFTIDNDLTYAKTLLEHGVDTICTNFITEKEIADHKDVMIKQPYLLDISEQMTDGVKRLEISNKYPNTKIPELPYPDSQEGRKFLGWTLCRPLDGSNHWYCKDGIFRIITKLKPGTDRDVRVFGNGEEMPVFDVKKGEVLQLVARWEDKIEQD